MLSHPEVEAIIQALKVFEPKEIGGKTWMRYHNLMQQINNEAHMQAVNGTEFVTDLLVTHNKLPVLVMNLLTCEVWKMKALPLLEMEEKFRTGVDPLTSWALYAHETILANLLELVLFNKEAIEALSDESLILLVDYCHRKLTYLNTLDRKEIQAWASNEESDLHGKTQLHHAFQAATFAVTIARYIAERMSQISLSIVHRFVVSQDFITASALLLNDSPWTVVQKKKTYRYENGKWGEITAKDRLRVTKEEVQLWLLLWCLIIHAESRDKYTWSESIRELLTKIKDKMGTTLIDQVAPLRDLKGALEVICLQMPPSSKQAFLIEEVPEFWNELVELDWKEIAIAQLFEFLKREPLSKEEVDKLLESLTVAATSSEMQCSRCGKPADQKCSRCKRARYCSRDCQVKSWKAHKKECIPQ